MGRGGIYYRQTLRGPGGHPLEQPHEIVDTAQPVESTPGESTAEDYPLPATTSALLADLRRAHEALAIFPAFLIGLLVLLMLMLGASTPPLVVGIFALLGLFSLVLIRHHDVIRCTAVLTYDLGGEYAKRFAAFQTQFAKFCQSRKIWVVQTISATPDWKRNAGATRLHTRRAIVPGVGRPRRVVSNLEFPMIATGSQTIYFLPDTAIVIAGRSVSAQPYTEISATTSYTNFSESESPPVDAQIVGQTWRYVNKNGGPDRRFSNNRQIPILRYGTVDLVGANHFECMLQCSTTVAAEALANALGAMRESARHGESQEPVSITLSPLATTLEHDKPKHWEYLLGAEVIRANVEALVRQFEQFKNGTAGGRPTTLGTLEFASWVSGKCAEALGMVPKIADIMTKDLFEAFGPPGVPGDAEKIKAASTRLVGICADACRWGREIWSHPTPSELVDIRERLTALPPRMLNAVLDCARALAANCTAGATGEVTVRLELAFVATEIKSIIERLTLVASRQAPKPKGPSAGGRPARPGRAPSPTGRPSPKSPYEVLQVSPSASPAEIMESYKRLAQLYHPDKVAGLAPEYKDIAEVKMREINAAFATLSQKT